MNSITLQEVSTERLDDAVAKLRDPKMGRRIQYFTYDTDAQPDHVSNPSYTLSEVYMELARRFA